MNFKLFLLLTIVVSCAAVYSQSFAASLVGYTEGAEVHKIAKTEGQIDVLSGVIYSQVKSTRAVRQLRMTLLVPRTESRKAAIIYFPGGGFTSADYEKFIEMRMALAKKGFVVAAAEYRVVPDRFPALVNDGKAAVRYLREHADEYGIDPARIGVLGDSAGGYLVQMLGLTCGEKAFDKGAYLDKSSDVQAVATIYGISSLLNIAAGFPQAVQEIHTSPAVTEALLVHGPAFRDKAGASIGSDKEKALYASPMGHVQGKKPPFLIMHGSNDNLVSPVQSLQLYKALKAEGNIARYVLLEGAGHGDLSWYQGPVIKLVADWFFSVLGGPVAEAKAVTDPGANL